MTSEAATVSPRRAWLELAAVVVVAFAVLAPGLARYSPVDPWETHYGEVGRMMRQTHDYVHLQWPGTNYEGAANEGFRSKPVLTPWLIAAGMHAVGLAADGGYSGELVHDGRAMIALRLPFVTCAVAGLALLWWMLARLVRRRVAWLALLVVGTSPLYALLARQAMPDMPLAATVIGAVSLLVLALEDGDRPCSRGVRRTVLGLTGGAVAAQAIYYAYYFVSSPALAVHCPISPAAWLPAAMLALLAGLWHGAWRFVAHPRAQPRSRAGAIAAHLLAMSPITTMRQVYLLGAYALLGVSVLAKGPPGVAIVVAVAVLHVVLRGQWRALYDGACECKRGALLLAAISVPWHVAMFLKDGVGFINDYLFFHILERAGVGVDKSPGTFEMYTSQLGVGMWLWAALVPAALASALLRARADTRADRVRFTVAIWAIASFALFALVQTKFHHYILPAVAPLGVLVAILLDDLLAGRDRLHPLFAAIAAAIALLVCRDLMHEPERWMEMFVFRYDRPWPAAEPYAIDVSDGFLALGALATVAIALAATRWRRVGVGALAAAGLAIAIWALQVYMPLAGTHWGMRDAFRAYYDQRTIYGEKLVYFGAGELYDDWHAATDRRRFATHVPEALQIGQPMTVTVELHQARAERIIDREVVLVGAATAIGDHTVELTLAPGERDRLAPLWNGAADGPRGRPPLRLIDADRLIAWQLYWRGENFWSQEEIWGPLPEQKSSFPEVNTAKFVAYMNDRTRTPLGRRYFIISEAWHLSSVRALLPTARARDTFELVDTTSNKFSLAGFTL